MVIAARMHVSQLVSDDAYLFAVSFVIVIWEGAGSHKTIARKTSGGNVVEI